MRIIKSATETVTIITHVFKLLLETIIRNIFIVLAGVIVYFIRLKTGPWIVVPLIPMIAFFMVLLLKWKERQEDEKLGLPLTEPSRIYLVTDRIIKKGQNFKIKIILTLARFLDKIPKP